MLQVLLKNCVSLTVGEGSSTITTRFGSDAIVRAASLHRFIDAAREALQSDNADVVLKVEDIEFLSGHDLETFLEKHRLDAATGEVEQ